MVQTHNGSDKKDERGVLPTMAEHITDFIRWLDKDQRQLTNNSITILDKDKTQHFVGQIYASGMLDV